jgi:uncharacterized protein (TIGR03083 family)
MPRDWAAVHAERTALADDLADLSPEHWATPSLCAGWTVRHVLAHLAAAASLNTARWLGGVIRCRFDFNRQVEMRLREQLGSSPDETLANLSAIRGLRLEATDGSFATGAGPLVSGPTLALIMVMAGRAGYSSQLQGPGIETLRGRLPAES